MGSISPIIYDVSASICNKINLLNENNVIHVIGMCYILRAFVLGALRENGIAGLGSNLCLFSIGQFLHIKGGKHSD